MRKQLIIPILKELAEELGIKIHLEPQYGMWGALIFDNKKWFCFKDVNFNINMTMSTALAKDKDYCSYFLNELGVNTPTRFVVFNKSKNKILNLEKKIIESLQYAEQIGFPVIIKPNNMSKGSLIFKAENKESFLRFIEIALLKCDIIQIQKFYYGNDYRIVVLGDKVISAYQRIPLFVIGDGYSTIEQLIDKKQESFISTGRDTIIDKNDIRLNHKLIESGLCLNSVIESGKRVQLHDISNLSLGGTCIDLTDIIHAKTAEFAVSMSQMLYLNLCGIDIIANNLSEPLSRDYVVLEINSAPGLDNYAFDNEKQDIYVKKLYREILTYIKNNFGT